MKDDLLASSNFAKGRMNSTPRVAAANGQALILCSQTMLIHNMIVSPLCPLQSPDFGYFHQAVEEEEMIIMTVGHLLDHQEGQENVRNAKHPSLNIYHPGYSTEELNDDTKLRIWGQPWY